MASIPGFRFDITGASGSQGLLTPKNSWRAYVFPRGGYASQDSTGTTITFDDATVASRFAVNDWIQIGTSVDNIRQVDSISTNTIVVNTAVTVSQNDRVFLIGTTQPTVVGGSATYTSPATTIRMRDDDGSTAFTNSMITSNSDGLIQGFGTTNFYDCMIQDGNQSNQGSVIDLTIGSVEGISTSQDAVFGNVTINGVLGVTGEANFDAQVIIGETVSIVGTSGDYAHDGTALFGQTVTVNGAFGVSGTAVFGDTAVFTGTWGNYFHTGWAEFGNSVTFHAAIGVTGNATFAANGRFEANVSVDSAFGVTGVATFDGQVTSQRINMSNSTGLVGGDVVLSSGWGNTVVLTSPSQSNDQRGFLEILCQGSGIGANPTVTITFTDGAYTVGPRVVLTRGELSAPTTGFWIVSALSTTVLTVQFVGTPQTGNSYKFFYVVFG